MNFETNDKQKTIETDYLNVRGNLISWNNTILQISNISMITTNEFEKKPIPIYPFLLFIVGLLTFQFLASLSIVCIVSASLWGYFYYSNAKKIAELKILSFKLNSGETFGIVFNNQTFLNKVISVLTKILSQEIKSSNITFDIKNNNYAFKDNTFNDSSSAVNNMYKGE